MATLNSLQYCSFSAPWVLQPRNRNTTPEIHYSLRKEFQLIVKGKSEQINTYRNFLNGLKVMIRSANCEPLLGQFAKWIVVIRAVFEGI